MLIALSVVALLVVAAGAALVGIELRRYRHDRSRVPPLSAEEAARDRWNVMAADLVAAISILGALVAWQASTTFGVASDQSGTALHQTAQYQAALSQQDTQIEFSARLAQLYQQHTTAETSLYAHSDAARRAGQTALANELDAEARIEIAQARSLANAFSGYTPDKVNADGTVTFDRQAHLDFASSVNADLRTLSAAHIKGLEAQADRTRALAQNLVLASALFIGAVFFLTVARLGWRNRRLHAAVPALVSASAATVMLVLAATGA